jgi:hypothetical protein
MFLLRSSLNEPKLLITKMCKLEEQYVKIFEKLCNAKIGTSMQTCGSRTMMGACCIYSFRHETRVDTRVP